MRCQSRGIWRAYLDGELSAQDRITLQQHLTTCRSCQARLEALKRQAAQVAKVMIHEEPKVQIEAELTKTRLRLQTLTYGRNDMVRKTVKRVWRPVAASALTVALLVGVYSFAPTRALARQLLSVFRVESFAVVRIDTDSAQVEQAAQKVESLLEGIEPSIVTDAPEQVVGSAAEASAIAGFQVRMPGDLSGATVSSIQVKGESEAVIDVTRDILGQFLALVGMDSNQLPADFEQGQVTIRMPGTVSIMGEKLTLIQALAPEVSYPGEIDPNLLGEAGFRLMGLSEKDAQRLSQDIDWTTTLVLPIPRDFSELREVEVAGSKAVIMTPQRDGDDWRTVLVWEKGGVVNMLSYQASAERLLKMAESMY